MSKGGTLYIQPVIGKGESQSSSSIEIKQPGIEPQESSPYAPEPTYEQRETRAPLAVLLADKIVNGTHGTMSIDLVRRNQPDARNRTSLFTYKEPNTPPPSSSPWSSWLTGWPQQRRRRISPMELERQRQLYDYDNLPNTAFNTSGARCKILRHVSFGPSKQFTTSHNGSQFTAPMFDIGAGFEFQFATAEMHPILRLKVNNAVSFKLLPEPMIKFQKRMQLGTSGIGIRASYECPIGADLRRFYAPPARLMLTFDNSVENGVRLTQNGVEFAANQALLGGKARVRAAGAVRLPSEIPFDEDELFLRFEPKRLGMKLKW